MPGIITVRGQIENKYLFFLTDKPVIENFDLLRI